MATKVFISYRREDSRYQARDIHSAFCKAIPSDHVFMDVDSIPPGANFRKIRQNWVDECEVLLALIGPGWIDARDPKTKGRRLDNKSDFVHIEIGEVLARGIPVVPVLLDSTPMPDVDLLPDDLKELVDRQPEFVEYRTFYADVERLIRKLRLYFERHLAEEHEHFVDLLEQAFTVIVGDIWADFRREIRAAFLAEGGWQPRPRGFEQGRKISQARYCDMRWRRVRCPAR